MMNNLKVTGIIPFFKKILACGLITITFPLYALSYAGTDARSHSQPHTHDHSGPHTHAHGDAEHTHLPVDYSFQPDAGQYQPPQKDEEGYFWWKGNLHTHTLWSDGDQFPEVVTQWYYEHGYHFLAISDHNILMRGDKWINPETSRFVQRAGDANIYDVYRERFGDDWIETREIDGEFEVRLKPLHEVQALFQKPGRFLLIEAEEITENEHRVHVNATNILELIEPVTAENTEETIRTIINKVVKQEEETGQRMIPHLNHPNFRFAITAENMAPIENLSLFEVYNGHRANYNFGAEDGVKNLDRVWDIVLTRRLAELGLGMLYGVATDDAHNYEQSERDISRPGRGWVNVRSRYLTPEHIVDALERGEFYSSSGVSVASVKADSEQYRVRVDVEPGVDYTIQFIGTRAGYDAASQPFVDAEGNARDDRTRIYSDDIGEVLMEVKGSEATYEFTGDEIYVRAKIISSKEKENYFEEGEREKAWLQPVRPGR